MAVAGDSDFGVQEFRDLEFRNGGCIGFAWAGVVWFVDFRLLCSEAIRVRVSEAPSNESGRARAIE